MQSRFATRGRLPLLERDRAAHLDSRTGATLLQLSKATAVLAGFLLLGSGCAYPAYTHYNPDQAEFDTAGGIGNGRCTEAHRARRTGRRMTGWGFGISFVSALEASEQECEDADCFGEIFTDAVIMVPTAVLTGVLGIAGVVVLSDANENIRTYCPEYRDSEVDYSAAGIIAMPLP